MPQDEESSTARSLIIVQDAVGEVGRPMNEGPAALQSLSRLVDRMVRRVAIKRAVGEVGRSVDVGPAALNTKVGACFMTAMSREVRFSEI